MIIIDSYMYKISNLIYIATYVCMYICLVAMLCMYVCMYVRTYVTIHIVRGFKKIIMVSDVATATVKVTVQRSYKITITSI